MKPSRLVVVLAIGSVMFWAVPAHGQGYRVRIDTRYQSVAYRGVQLDSILAADAVVGEGGGWETPDGFAAYCPNGALYCTYYTAGDSRRGNPFVASVDGRIWGLGVTGLSIVGKARLGWDISDPVEWPGVDPALQLVEGYAEYVNRLLTVQLGRTNVMTRLGYWGFDGARADVRLLDDKFFVQGYGGWGLARGVALPVTSSALNPLDDLQPRERQVLWGAGLGWSQQGVDARLIYQRQISSESDNIVGEFAAFDATIRPSASFAIVGGVDYDVATGNWGTADLAATITAPRGGLAVTVGGKRYRPYFPLWTIWGAFSPVGYSAGYGSVSYAPISGLELWTRGEAYGYEDTEAESSNVSVESDGWRWTLGGAYKWTAGWTFKADYFIDKGPGSRSLGFDFVTTWQPMGSVYVTADVQRLQRPLEFRFDDIDVWSYGLRLDYRTVRGVRLNGEVRYYDEKRDRLDGAAFSWNQFRLNLGAMVNFGTPIVGGLHPAILRVPEVRGTR
jgi:hypothetical protein